MRILLLTQWFDPEPVIKGLLLAKSLASRGHDVHVITGFPNYPGGAVYPPYRLRPIQRESMSGIPVTRVALYPSHDASAVGRILNYGSFAASATIAGICTRFRPDVAYIYHPPLTVGLAGSMISLFRRIPFVYDIQDLWPDTLEATGMVGSPRVLQLVGALAQIVYRRAEILIAQSPGFVERLQARGVPEQKIRLIYNWCHEANLHTGESPARANDDGNRFTVVFAGNMGKAQALKSVLEAAALVWSEAPDVRFVLVGGGLEVDALKQHSRQLDLQNVDFMDRVPMDEIGRALNSADALLVHLRDSPLFAITVPAKTQAYMYTGKPIVMAVGGNGAELISRSGAGVVAAPENPRSIAAAVLRLAALSPAERATMGENGRRFYDESMSLDVGTQRVIEALEDAIRQRAARMRESKP